MFQKAALVPSGEPVHSPLSPTQRAQVTLVWHLLLLDLDHHYTALVKPPCMVFGALQHWLPYMARPKAALEWGQAYEFVSVRLKQGCACQGVGTGVRESSVFGAAVDSIGYSRTVQQKPHPRDFFWFCSPWMRMTSLEVDQWVSSLYCCLTHMDHVTVSPGWSSEFRGLGEHLSLPHASWDLKWLLQVPSLLFSLSPEPWNW